MALKRIKDWLVSITSFRTGDVIPVDGPDGSAKMSKDDLLKVTAQNALAGNVAQAFDPTRDEDHKYLAGESVVYNGKTYMFIFDHYGAWNARHVSRKNIDEIYSRNNEVNCFPFTTNAGANRIIKELYLPPSVSLDFDAYVTIAIYRNRISPSNNKYVYGMQISQGGSLYSALVQSDSQNDETALITGDFYAVVDMSSVGEGTAVTFSSAKILPRSLKSNYSPYIESLNENPNIRLKGDIEWAVKVGEKLYRVCKIGKYLLLADNLQEPIGTEGVDWRWNFAGDKNSSVSNRMGMLYTWNALCSASKEYTSAFASIVPRGWRLPYEEDADFIALLEMADLKDLSSGIWGSANKTDYYGFSAIAGGFASAGTSNVTRRYEGAYFWEAEKLAGNDNPCVFCIRNGFDYLIRLTNLPANHYMSVRLVCQMQSDTDDPVDYGCVRFISKSKVPCLPDNYDYALKSHNGVLYWGTDDKKEYVVDINGGGDYTSFVAALKDLENVKDCKVRVKKGVYNIIAELGNDYFTNYTNDKGPLIGNGISIQFEAGAKIVCHYEGSNTTFLSTFSPLNYNAAKGCGFVIDGLDIDVSRCRYCIHDESNSSALAYKNVYKNCRMKMDNSDNEEWHSRQCIGGGLGQDSIIEISGCTFYSVSTSERPNAGAVTYHNSGASSGRSNVIVRDCYVKGSTDNILCRYYGTSTEMSTFFICGCSLPVAPAIEREASATVINFEMTAFNNEIRA